MPDRRSRWRRRGPDSDQEKKPGANDEHLPLHSTHGITPDDERFFRGIHNVRRLVSGEWTWDVLVALHEGPLQYTVLLGSVQTRHSGTGWSGKKHHRLRDGTLNRTLRRLEQGELVQHDRESAFPYRSTYELTAAAKKLLSAAVPLAEWAESNAGLLERAQQRRRAEETRDS